MKNLAFILRFFAISTLLLSSFFVSIATLHAQQDSSSDHATTIEQININTANAKQLASLPGIGKVKAQKIIAHRDENGAFTSIDNLSQVPGIGKSTVAKIKSLVTVQ